MNVPKFPVTKKEAEKQGIPFSSEANKNTMFPCRLRKLRDDKNISQAKLASDIGVSKSTIGLYETGDTLPDIKTTDTLCDYFGVSADYLLGRVLEPTNDVTVQAIVEYTGLSRKNVELFHTWHAVKGFTPAINKLKFSLETINLMLESVHLYNCLDFVWESHIIDKQLSFSGFGPKYAETPEQQEEVDALVAEAEAKFNSYVIAGATDKRIVTGDTAKMVLVQKAIDCLKPFIESSGGI